MSIEIETFQSMKTIEWLNNVEITLTGETGSVLFTTKSDSKGSFSFRKPVITSQPPGIFIFTTEAILVFPTIYMNV